MSALSRRSVHTIHGQARGSEHRSNTIRTSGYYPKPSLHGVAVCPPHKPLLRSCTPAPPSQLPYIRTHCTCCTPPVDIWTTSDITPSVQWDIRYPLCMLGKWDADPSFWFDRRYSKRSRCFSAPQLVLKPVLPLRYLVLRPRCAHHALLPAVRWVPKPHLIYHSICERPPARAVESHRSRKSYDIET